MRRLLAVVLGVFAAVSAAAQTPVPGQNINMVSKDPYLQKQNEPSIAVMSNNPCHLVAGANDYRTVNMPGLPEDKEIGDAWVGWYTSIDCGQTWVAELMHGYPQDSTAEGMASPVKGLTSAADPTVRAGTGGFFAYSFIAFNRGTNVGKLAVARGLDFNNKEAGQPIHYIDTKTWDTGSAGQFIDKPYMLVTKGAGGATCSIGGRSIPANTIHLAWTVFVGNSDQLVRTKVYYARSSNCGASLDAPATKLSEGYPVNQGATIAVTPAGHVYVIWRQFRSTNGSIDQMLMAKSTDGGKTFTKAAAIPSLQPMYPFDQGTTSKSFRTNAFPTATSDQFGRVYVAAALRNFGPGNQARVVVTSTTDGVTWTMPQAVDSPQDRDGFQIQPALTYAGGKLRLAWIDFRDDMSVKWDDYIREIYPLRHTMDVRGAEAATNTGGTLSWTTYGILQEASPAATVPRISRYLEGNYGGLTSRGLKQLQFNRSNLKLYAGGTRPFIGDFIDIAGLGYVLQGSQWLSNDGLIAAEAIDTVHAAWTDNRDAVVGHGQPEPISDTEEGAALDYVAPGTPACTGDKAKLTTTRNANVYTSRISPGLFVAAPGNAKPTGYRTDENGQQVLLERAFAVMVRNDTTKTRTFRLNITNQPPDWSTIGRASFNQFPAAVLTQIDATVPARSAAARTVYVISATKYPRIEVKAIDVSATDPLNVTGTTILNPDVENPDVENPDVENPDVENPDVENAEVYNPDVENPDVENPDVENPDVENPDVENPDVENPDVENPDVENPDVENPDVENPDVENPDVENPDVENQAITDYTVELTNKGNTTTSYQVQTDVAGNTSGYVFQLIARRVYKVPAANVCEQAFAAQNEVLFNITNPDLSPGPLPDANLSDPTKNPTVLVRPGEKIRITLRAWDKDYFYDSATHAPFTTGQDGKVAPFCPIVGGPCTTVTNVVTTTVAAEGANTGESAPTVVTFPSAPVLQVTTTSLPPGVYDVGLQQPSYPYSQQLHATGGASSSYTWSRVCGIDCLPLPPGLTLSPSGLISGMPSDVGTYPFTVQVTDGGQTATQDLSITVVDVYENMNFVTEPPATVTPATPFTVRVEVRDGSNAVIPGTQVQIGLLDNATGATLTPAVPSAVTNDVGVATLSMAVDLPGSYTLVAARPTLAGAQDVTVSTVFNVAVPLVVTNTNDTGTGSLRQAILTANATPGPQVITFDIPGPGLHTISPLGTGLPEITDSVVIDGRTQPGYAGTPLIEIEGSQLSPAQPGYGNIPGLLFLETPGPNAVLGLTINRFPQAGIRISHLDGLRVQGNRIGVDPSGTLARPNGTAVLMFGTSNSLIGGAGPGEGNILGGNNYGIVLHDFYIGGTDPVGSNGNIIRGNIIGRDTVTGLGAPNTWDGVFISDSGSSNFVGGAPDGTAQNVIAGQGRNAVTINSTATDNTVRYNRIENNGGLGIDLGFNGVTANDVSDVDTGPNDLQNYPVISLATYSGSTLAVTGTLNSTLNTYFTIDFYVSPTCTSAAPQGRTWFASTIVLTSASGNAAFTASVAPLTVPAGSSVTATATRVSDANGTQEFSTSEFSACAAVEVIQ